MRMATSQAPGMRLGLVQAHTPVAPLQVPWMAPPQSLGQANWLQAAPPKPSWQVHTPVACAQVPWPLQSPGHRSWLQSLPWWVWSHVHTPVPPSHVPWPLQSPGQLNWLQSFPACWLSQVHAPVRISQVPWPLQLAGQEQPVGHISTLQSGPLKPMAHSHAPSLLQVPWALQLAGQAHAPLLQLLPGTHAFPQAPQWRMLVLRLVSQVLNHSPSQSALGAVQKPAGSMQRSSMQVAPEKSAPQSTSRLT